jgi:DNA-binding winged helix-turn-helix (wHTH) protein
MKQMKKIILTQIPAPVEQALREHLGARGEFDVMAVVGNRRDVIEGHDPDLVIAGAAVHVPGCPVLLLSFVQAYRLGALLRQIGQMIAQPVLYIDDIAIGDYIFKPQEKALSREGAEDIALTDREVDILAYLVRCRATPISRENLLKNVWKYQEGVDTHTLETHIYRLRQKMEVSAEQPQLLLTVEGGYRLHLPETAV